MTDDPLKPYRTYMQMLNWSPSLQQRMKHDLSDAPLPSNALGKTPAFDVYEALEAVRTSWESYPLNSEAACDEHWKKFLPHRLGDLPAPLAVDMHFYRFVHALFLENQIYWTTPPSTIDRDELRRLAIRLDPGFLPAAEDAVDELVQKVISYLPDAAFKEIKPGSITVPFYDVHPHTKIFPTMLCAKTGEYEFKGERIFYYTNHDLVTRLVEANGHTWETWKPGKHDLVAAANAQGSTEAVLKKYLPPDSHLFNMLTAQVPFEVPAETFASHGIIIAPPGHGKTQLLSTFIARFLPDPDVGLVVLDPHGDLFNSLRDKVPAERLVVLDPSTNPPPLNVFDFGNAHEVQILQAFTYLMAALTGGMTDKQAGIIPYLLKLIRVIPNADITTLLELVTERPKKPEESGFISEVYKLPELDRKFFMTQFLGNKMPETKDAIAWKLSAALSYDAFRQMFTAKHNSFDAFAAIEQSKIVLVKGSERVLGEQGLSVFLQFIVAQLFLAAMKRDATPEKDRKLCILFADEASHVFNSQTARILTECRKYRLGFLAATQVIQQIPADVKAAIYGATAIKIAGPVAATDAMLLAREMHTTGDEIRALKSRSGSHADWMLYISNFTDHALKVSVPFGALDRLFEAEPELPPVINPDEPAAMKQGLNEFSLRDVDLPLPDNVIVTPPPSKEAIFPGDWVLVQINGQFMFADPVRVRDVQKHQGTAFVFVEGTATGFELRHCIKVPPPPSEPPPVPQSTPQPTIKWNDAD